MASSMRQALSENDLRKLRLPDVKKSYLTLADDYNKIINGDVIYCNKCNSFYKESMFYRDTNYASGKFPICKSCIMKMVEQRKSDKDEPNETKESVQKVLMFMDLPYDDAFYNDCVKSSLDDTKQIKRSPFSIYITCLKSLPQYRNKTWEDSDFGSSESCYNELVTNKKPRKEIVKLFGRGFSNDDYLYLQDQYDSWCSRTQVDGKSQQTYIIRICFKLLDIYKAQKAGKDTDKLDRSLNELLGAANLQPRQNVGNAATDNLTFGQLIEKWENEEPIPEPSEEFKDVDKISEYVRVWFKGALSRSLNLDNGYSKEYDDYIEKYTVKKPEYIGDDGGDSQSIYSQIFGKEVE